jgi:hypothetical protein
MGAYSRGAYLTQTSFSMGAYSRGAYSRVGAYSRKYGSPTIFYVRYNKSKLVKVRANMII